MNTGILKTMCVTEKSTDQMTKLGQYVFQVALDATRTQVAQAVHETFGVKPVRVNILRYDGKRRRNRMRRAGYGWTVKTKKAIIQLKKGEKIEI